MNGESCPKEVKEEVKSKICTGSIKIILKHHTTF